MCTVTWRQETDRRYSLFFNRDELKTRLPALPPDIKSTPDGTRFVSPTDGDHGGTWLLANEFGLTVGILNNYAAGTLYEPVHPASRGGLVNGFAGCRSVQDVARQIVRTPLHGFRPFFLIAVDPGTCLRQWIWSGPTLPVEDIEDPALPLTTSSYRFDEVLARRRSRFEELGDTPSTDALAAFHDSSDSAEGAGAFSVRMRRPDAQTISLSRIDVTPDPVTFTYRPETIDSLEINPSVSISLPRSRAS